MTKIIAYYLPQFHTIPENDAWWGKGFTEWNNVKRAIPRFKGHNQPRIPLGNHYYNLLDSDVQEWQSKIAQENGIYGFCYYHYWYNGKLLLEKPAEQMLKNDAVTIPFCFSWANHSWRRTWGDYSKTVLMEQVYGGEKEWKAHFEYLLPFFKDKRYIKEDGKPLFLIYRPGDIPDLYRMTCYWNQLAIKNHLPGICFASQDVEYNICQDEEASNFSYNVEYQPDRAKQIYREPRYVINAKINEIFNFPWKFSRCTFDYDKLWKIVLRQKPSSEKSIPGAFVDWDNTPRFAERGTVCVGNTIEKFEKYLALQIKRTRQVYKSEYLFLFAWNEWGESAYLEPDEYNQYGLLEAVKKALQKGDAE